MATRYLSWKTYTAAAALEDFLRETDQVWTTGQGHFRWVLARRENVAVLIGSIGFTVDNHSVVFGYVLGRAHWGQGLMTEALRHLVDWSLAQPEIFRACAFCDVENPASARVMEKAGMTREGILRRYHIAPNLSPEPRDCILCAKVC